MLCIKSSCKGTFLFISKVVQQELPALCNAVGYDLVTGRTSNLHWYFHNSCNTVCNNNHLLKLAITKVNDLFIRTSTLALPQSLN